MFLLKQILPAAIVSMIVAAGVCGFALCSRKQGARSAAGPVAVGLAYLTGHFVITGWVSVPPADTTNWLPYLALAGAALGGSCGVLALKAWMRVLIFAVVAAGALRLLLTPKFSYGWSLTEDYLWMIGLTGAMVCVAIILDALVRQGATAIEMPAFLLIVCAGTSGALMLSGSMLLAQFAVVLGAAIVGSLVLSVRKVALGRGIVSVFTLLLVTLLLSGYFFAELPASTALLLALAPVLALIPIRLPTLAAFGVRTALVSVPILVALVLAFRSSPPLSY